MSNPYRLSKVRADALRMRRMTQLRLPVTKADEQPPYVEGQQLSLVEPVGYGRTAPVATVRVTSVSQEELEKIREADILASGYPNWTVLAYDWGQEHASKGFPWDVGTVVWVIKFEVEH